MSYQIRELLAADEPIIWIMLRHAAHEDSVKAVRQTPSLVSYAEHWGRKGDLGFGAFVEAEPAGAVWMRQWSAENQGYGFVREDIPELAIALVPDYRGQGIGTALLTQLLETAQVQHPAVSLSVRDRNPAVRLYKRLGFAKVEGSDRPNRVGGMSFKMVRYFDSRLI
ncbi:GNAT family N-acetyltransferase [Vacuolonema iberomarrocanum]|uniref:GNAT family N-acetyltransferase n=1 Tax=Vacuolonema iberomarrocanum TaxID=3454632 RepID=UPI003F6E3175